MQDEFDPDRRSLVAAIAALIGAAALPAEALAAPKRRGRRAPARFLTPARYAQLVAVSDTLIPATDTPGALAAKVPEKFDALLRGWASAATRTEIVGALAAIDARALASDKLAFAALTPARRKALLIEHEKEALRNVPRKDKLSALAAMMGAPSVADPGYNRIKTLVVNLYYNSEEAMTQELIYTHVPGKWQPSVKITPGTRPEAGGGLGG